MTGEPLLSIITVCRDRAPGLGRTLKSFAGLDFTIIETIVIDGSENDECVLAASAFPDAVTHYWHGPDRGLYHAMNKGAGRARGNGLLFVNAGDEIHNARRLNALVREHGAGFARAVHFGGHVQAIGPYALPVRAPAVTAVAIAQGIFPSHQAAILPAGFSRANPYDETLRFVSDAKVLKRAFLELRHVRLDEALVVVEHGGISSLPGDWRSVLRHCREGTMLERSVPATLAFMARVLARKAVADLAGYKTLEAMQIARALRRAGYPAGGGGALTARARTAPAE